MDKRFDFLAGALLLVIVLVSCAACATTSTPSTGNTPSASTAKQCPPAPTSCDLIWSGGPVQHQPTAYAIFWGQQWEGAPYKAAADTVLNYLQQVGGTSYANILSQYSDAQGPISNQLKVGDFWIDDRTTDPLSATTTCGGKAVTDSALKDEINYAIVANGWPVNDPDDTYLVYTPPLYAVDTEGAPDDAVSPCSNAAAPKGYCGYHSFNTTLNSARVYAAIVYPTGACSVAGHHVPVSAQDDAGQTLVEVTAHEQFEAATDPDPNPGTIGWQDVTGGTGEMSDKCAWTFPPGGLTQLGSGSFAVPLQWSNATHSCVNSYAGATPPPPTTSYPRLASAYQGIGNNSTFSASGSLVLTDIKQDQQVISGKVFWGDGLVGDGSFTGTIDAKGNVIFTDTFPTIPECCSALTFSGVLAADGSLSGTYTGTPTPGQPTQHGTWQVKPYQPAANPRLGTTYDGMVTNLTVNVTTTLGLTNIVQNQQAISGNIVVGPGLLGTGTFTGTIASDGSVTFTDVDIVFTGFLFPDGGLSGTYIVTDAAQDGTWQTTPG